jgi:CubicO group peptidase (beta-lactamase class C family)
MAGGGLFSTASDYGRFAQMLAGHGMYQGEQILGRKTAELMLTSQSRPPEVPVVPPGWGFREGWGMALG